MPFLIVRQDITKMDVDAIVNAANSSLSAGGGVCGSIHRAAGPGLERECLTLGGCSTGDAKATGGYDLPAKHVIHTVGPVWKGGASGEAAALTSCYRRSLEIAAELQCESVAFPLISSGIFGYPKNEAFRVAESAIRNFLTNHDMTVYLVIFSRDAVDIGHSLYKDIRHFIDDNYVKEAEKLDAHRRAVYGNLSQRKASIEDSAPMATAPVLSQPCAFSEDAVSSLEGMLKTLDESFSEMLLRLIDERGISDVECYKRANIDRKLFSKIRSDPHYRPSKLTVLAFAVALELSLSQTKKFLESAGFALSRSCKCDVIIEYFISRKSYNIFEINEALFSFDEPTLGNLH